MEGTARLVVAGPGDRTFAIREVAAGEHVVDDETSHRRLGSLRGDLTPFVIDIDGASYTLFAGSADRRMRQVTVE